MESDRCGHVVVTRQARAGDSKGGNPILGPPAKHDRCVAVAMARSGGRRQMDAIVRSVALIAETKAARGGLENHGGA